MNKRIFELLKQATTDVNPEDREWVFSRVDQAKFAELIVRECMACSTWVGKMNTNTVEPIYTAHAINQRIKKHFGVEE